MIISNNKNNKVEIIDIIVSNFIMCDILKSTDKKQTQNCVRHLSMLDFEELYMHLIASHHTLIGTLKLKMDYNRN